MAKAKREDTHCPVCGARWVMTVAGRQLCPRAPLDHPQGPLYDDDAAKAWSVCSPKRVPFPPLLFEDPPS